MSPEVLDGRHGRGGPPGFGTVGSRGWAGAFAAAQDPVSCLRTVGILCDGLRGIRIAHVHFWLSFAPAVESCHRSLTCLCAYDVDSLGTCSAMRGMAVV